MEGGAVCRFGARACDGIWDLEHIDPGPPDAACTMVGHDEDNDGLDDGCDPCPFADDNTSDADGDGIAGICDPEPSVSNTVVLLQNAMRPPPGELLRTLGRGWPITVGASDP